MRTLAGVLAGAVAVATLAGCSGAERKQATAPVLTTTSTAPATTTTGAVTTTTAKKAAAKSAHSLVAFSSCRSLLRHVKREALRVVTPYGFPAMGNAVALQAVARADSATVGTPGSGGGTTTGAGVEASSTGAEGYSGTNNQEEGVDEPDIVKTDGRRLIDIENNVLRIVDITTDTPRLLGSLPPEPNEGMREALLSGNRVLVFGDAWDPAPPYPAPGTGSYDEAVAASRFVPQAGGRSILRVVDITDPAHPKVEGTMSMEGQYVSARLVNGVVRLVVTTGGRGPRMRYPTAQGDEAASLADNRAAIQRSTAADWLPHYTLDRPGRAPVTGLLAPCASVLRPQQFSGLGTVSVLTVDPAELKPANPACVLGGGRIVYSSATNLYVATERWAAAAGDAALPPPRVVPGGAAPGQPGGSVPTVGTRTTELHQFLLPGREPAAYVASGQVDGQVLNQFSLSEHKGRLRLAATRWMASGQTEGVVYVLEAKDGRLVVVGRVGNLGHERETIQSVRFIGDRGYVVTFRQTDPLYVIDLHDPAHPAVRGELQVPGFSSYLHPLSDDVLLGVGQGPGDQGGQGLQLSLFNVADPAHPVRIANKVFNSGWSEAQHDHHALLWWSPTGQLVLPLTMSEASGYFSGAVVEGIDLAHGFGSEIKVTHQGSGNPQWPEGGYPPIRRAVVVGSRLVTVSPLGVAAATLATGASTGWLGW